MNGRRLSVLLVVGLIAFLYAWRLGERAFWEPDEPRYAEIGREMLVSGDWATPRLNHVKYYEKPPLTYWIVAASFGTLGVSEGAARVGPILAAFLVLGAAWITGRTLLGPRAAALGTLLFALSPLSWAAGRLLVTDMLLTAGVWWGFAGYALALAAKKRGASILPAMALSGLGLAIGVLSKGPIAIVLFLFGVIPARLLAGRSAALSALGWGVAAAVVLLFAAPWFVWMSVRDPAFAWFFFIHEHVLRFATPTAHREEAWYFYLLILFGGLFPTSVLLPWAIGGERHLVRDRLARWLRIPFLPAADRRQRPDDPAVPEVRDVGRIMLLSISLLTVAFFTASKSKLASYIIPAAPALCLIAAAALSRVMKREERDPAPIPLALRASLGVAALIAAAIAVAIHLLGLPDDLFPRLGAWTLWITVLLVPLALALGFAAARGSVRALNNAGAAVAALVFALLLSLGVISERLDHLQSVKETAQWVSAQAGPDDLIGSYGTLLQGLIFYTGRRTVVIGGRGELTYGISIEPDADSWFPPKKQMPEVIEGRRAYIVVPRKFTAEALHFSGGRLHVVHDGPRYSVLSNDPSIAER